MLSEERKAKIAAARAARKDAGKNMFNPEVNIQPIARRNINTGPKTTKEKQKENANQRENNENNATTRGTTEPGANYYVPEYLNGSYEARRSPGTYRNTEITRQQKQASINAIRKKTLKSIPMTYNNSGGLNFTVKNVNTGTLNLAHQIGKKRAKGNFTPINNRPLRPWKSSMPNSNPVEEVGSSGCLGGTCNPQTRKKGFFWGGRRKSRKNKKSKKSKSRKNKKRRTCKRRRV